MFVFLFFWKFLYIEFLLRFFSSYIIFIELTHSFENLLKYIYLTFYVFSCCDKTTTANLRVIGSHSGSRVVMNTMLYPTRDVCAVISRR